MSLSNSAYLYSRSLVASWLLFWPSRWAFVALGNDAEARVVRVVCLATGYLYYENFSSLLPPSLSLFLWFSLCVIYSFAFLLLFFHPLFSFSSSAFRGKASVLEFSPHHYDAHIRLAWASENPDYRKYVNNRNIYVPSRSKSDPRPRGKETER